MWKPVFLCHRATNEMSESYELGLVYFTWRKLRFARSQLV